MATAPELFGSAPETIRAMRDGDVAEVVAIERASYQFPWSEGIFRDCLRVGYVCRVVTMARQVMVVSREGLPHYRVRGEFSARSERGRMAIAWVWDVYDSQNRRALHITGEETVGPVRDPWGSLDDQAVGRIALGGVEPLVAFLASAEASPRTPVAVSDDDTPEASGIFRVFRKVWPKSEDKKPTETPPKTSDTPAARPVQRAVAIDPVTDYSALPARAR